MALILAGPHGGNIYAAACDFRKPLSAIVDFSASINPLGPSPHVGRILAESMPFLRHYPDPDCVNLRNALSCRLELSPDHFVAANGSTELIDLIPRALSIRSALIVGPTFSEYAAGVQRSGGKTSVLQAKRSQGYRPPLEQVVDHLRSSGTKRKTIDAVFLCHPNSPTGQACDPAGMRSLLNAAHCSHIWVILDEAFIEYCEERSMLPSLIDFPRLVLLRSFTKFYALPGLRVGFSVSSPRIAGILRRFQPPWSVNVMAQQAAKAAIEDRAHARRSLDYLQQERQRFTRRLTSLPAVTVFPSDANFLLLELRAPYRAKTVAMQLRRQGLLIRDCSSVPGLNSRTVRVAVRTKNENDRLVAAFKTVLR